MMAVDTGVVGRATRPPPPKLALTDPPQVNAEGNDRP